MASLNTYLQQVQRFVRDPSQQVLNPLDLIEYINRARREVAMRAECIRVLPLTSSAIASATVTAEGSGYTDPGVTISAPDYPNGLPGTPNGVQATAVAVVTGGSITAVQITNGGSGYFQPTMTITDPTGTGAAVAAVMPTLAVTVPGQEVYPFSYFDLSPFPGVGEIYYVRTVAVIFSQFRYVLRYRAFSEYQAYVRQYSTGFFQYVPSDFTQFGQGASGSLYMYPIPNQVYQFEPDCLGLPSDLQTDTDYEAIPDPWTDAVPYYAAHLAYLELQNMSAANYYLDLFAKRVTGFSGAARTGRRINMYGRG